MRKLNSSDYENLTDRWIFMDIAHFMSDVDDECITRFDGFGQYVYADEKCDLYVDDESPIDFNELSKYDYFDLDDLIKDKTIEKYHLIGVFWYNK